jgi:3-oxoacyl-[acyl-carrier-protein] synthase III
MIGIEAIASYLPAGRISNLERLDEFGIGLEFLLGKIGVPTVIRRRDDEETSDLCVRAFEALRRRGEPGRIGAVIVCTQNPDGGGLPHTAAIIHGKLGLPDEVAAFDISLGCSGYVYALALALAFLETHGLERGLLFTADPYSKIIDPGDKNTSLLFSDAATVTLLGPRPRLRLCAARFATRGSRHADLQRRNGSLHMNGRAIFNFSMTAVPAQVREILATTGWTLEDVDQFILHQGSRYLLDRLGRRLEVPREKLPSNLAEVGNTVSSSVPLLLERYVDDVTCRRLLLCGFGVGLSWGTALLERVEASTAG